MCVCVCENLFGYFSYGAIKIQKLQIEDGQLIDLVRYFPLFGILNKILKMVLRAINLEGEIVTIDVHITSKNYVERLLLIDQMGKRFVFITN